MSAGDPCASFGGAGSGRLLGDPCGRRLAMPSCGGNGLHERSGGRSGGRVFREGSRACDFQRAPAGQDRRRRRVRGRLRREAAIPLRGLRSGSGPSRSPTTARLLPNLNPLRRTKNSRTCPVTACARRRGSRGSGSRPSWTPTESTVRHTGCARCWSRRAGGSGDRAAQGPAQGTGRASALDAPGPAGAAPGPPALAGLGRRRRVLCERRELRLPAGDSALRGDRRRDAGRAGGDAGRRGARARGGPDHSLDEPALRSGDPELGRTAPQARVECRRVWRRGAGRSSPMPAGARSTRAGRRSRSRTAGCSCRPAWRASRGRRPRRRSGVSAGLSKGRWPRPGPRPGGSIRIRSCRS